MPEGFYSGLIGALIGALVSFIGTYLTLKFNYRHLYADTVSKSRMQWIDNFRQEFSIFVGTMQTLLNLRISQGTQFSIPLYTTTITRPINKAEVIAIDKELKKCQNDDYLKETDSSFIYYLELFEKKVTANQVVVSNAYVKQSFSDQEKQAILNANIARAKLLTRLNQDVRKSGNEHNLRFEKRITEIDFNQMFYQSDIDRLIDFSRAILEPEWGRVKQEAKGEL